jgi:UDP-N-acetylglucosamine--N-acetylmuramyl-(pentapeptide) pyrophosphoryl-undecaprenol N-acetylglucosamine transferase
LLNARSFKEAGYCEVLFEEQLNIESLETTIKRIYENRHAYIQNMNRVEHRDALSSVFELLKRAAK